MYSPLIVAARVANTERLTGTPLREYSLAETDEYLAELRKLEDPTTNLPPPINTLPQHLFAFVTNEQRLCAIDFRYWCKYAKLVTDKRRAERFTPWPSQEYFLKRVANEEERQWKLWLDLGAKGEFTFKGRFIFLKSRQVGATRVSAILGTHLTYTFPNTYSLIASDTPEKGLELWRFWDKVYASLPWFLVPSRDTRVKGQEQYFAGLNSTLAVGSGNQKASFGQGLTIDFAHLTEVARFEHSVLDMIDKDLFWAFGSSQKSYSLCLLESTTEEGVGGWYEDQWNLSVEGKSLFIPTFLGWFLCPDKFKIEDPSIVVTDATQAIGRRIEARFPDVNLTQAQLRWYQVNRGEMEAKGKLPEFYSQVPSFPEEAFQYGHRSIFTYDCVERVGKDIVKPPVVRKWSGSGLVPAEWDGDPATQDGLITIWKPPEPGRIYFMAIDGAHGTADGDSTAIEVVAAPCGDLRAEEVAAWSSRGGGIAGISTVADVAMALGEFYRDPERKMPAQIAPESNPGSPSAFVTLRLIEAGYPNIFVHRRTTKIRGEQLKEDMGWHTTQTTRTPLVLRGQEALETGQLIVVNARVLQEMKTFEKKLLPSGLAKYEHADRKHDDTLFALFIAYWIATEEYALQDAERSARSAQVRAAKKPEKPYDPRFITWPDEMDPKAWPGNDFGKFPWTGMPW